MASISFTVYGRPVPKGRPRFNSKTGVVYPPKRTVDFERSVRSAASMAMRGHVILTGAVFLEVSSYFMVPKSWSKKKRIDALSGDAWHSCKPDGDNLLKAVCDALNGVVWMDDAQCSMKTIKKRYCDITERERTEVMIIG